MEIDFLGLSSKATLPVIKDEIINDGFNDIGIQFPFSNKGPAVLHSIPYKVSRESNDIHQKSFNHDGKAGNRFHPTAYPLQNDMQSHRRDMKNFPVSNQSISISVTNPFFKNHVLTHGLNLTGGNTMKQQLFGNLPMTSTPHSVIPIIAKSVEKSSSSPAQLTIFYDGKVNVYHDITPEKAQAIMLSASKGLALPSPLSASSQSGTQSGSGSTTTDETLLDKSHQVVATTPINKMEAPKSVGPIAPKALLRCAVPQARKASLARFLEKRKERVMSAAPYSLNKKSSESVA